LRISAFTPTATLTSVPSRLGCCISPWPQGMRMSLTAMPTNSHVFGARLDSGW
jgi:hypothetical protein